MNCLTSLHVSLHSHLTRCQTPFPMDTHLALWITSSCQSSSVICGTHFSLVNLIHLHCKFPTEMPSSQTNSFPLYYKWYHHFFSYIKPITRSALIYFFSPYPANLQTPQMPSCYNQNPFTITSSISHFINHPSLPSTVNKSLLPYRVLSLSV